MAAPRATDDDVAMGDLPSSPQAVSHYSCIRIILVAFGGCQIHARAKNRLGCNHLHPLLLQADKHSWVPDFCSPGFHRRRRSQVHPPSSCPWLAPVVAGANPGAILVRFPRRYRSPLHCPQRVQDGGWAAALLRLLLSSARGFQYPRCQMAFGGIRISADGWGWGPQTSILEGGRCLI